MADQIMTVAIEALLTITPLDDWSDLTAWVPSFCTWAKLAVVPASSSVRER